MVPTTNDDITGLDDSRVYAVMSYLLILVFIPLLTRRNDPFVYFHARQGLVVSLGLVLAILASMWVVEIGNLFFLLFLVVDVIALVQALLGRRWKIPVIGDVAQRIRV